jgi:hypothetical protein
MKVKFIYVRNVYATKVPLVPHGMIDAFRSDARAG